VRLFRKQKKRFCAQNNLTAVFQISDQVSDSLAVEVVHKDLFSDVCYSSAMALRG